MLLRDLFVQFEKQQLAAISATDAKVGKGGASDWSTYREFVGENRGRRDALADLRTLVFKLEKDEDA